MINIGRGLIRMLILDFLSWLDHKEKTYGTREEKARLIDEYLKVRSG